MSNASDGARIKVWPGIETDFQDNLNGGGGLGYVRNVTYDMFYHENNDRAITITQCYGQKNQTLCNEFPVSGILFARVQSQWLPKRLLHLQDHRNGIKLRR